MPDIGPDRFVNESGLVVENATGRVVGRLDGGGIVPYEPPRPEPGVIVRNPEGFSGFPDHDRDHADYRPETHGLDPARYFAHFEAEHPLFVENSTGIPRYRVANGQLQPIEG
jgi:hypothetical protein